MAKKKTTKKSTKKLAKKNAAATEVVLENEDFSQYLLPGMHVIPGELIPKLVDNNKFQPRLSTVITEEFREEITAAGGNYFPVKLRPNGDVLETIDGRRRVLACATMELPLKVIVEEMDEKQAWTESIASFNREGLTLFEEMLAYHKSAVEYAMIDSEIANKFGKNLDRCNILRRVAQILPGENSELIDFLDAGIGYTDLRVVIPLEKWDFIKQFLSLKIDHSLSSKDLGQYVKLQQDVDYLSEALGPNIKTRIYEYWEGGEKQQDITKNVDVPSMYLILLEQHEMEPDYEAVMKKYSHNVQKALEDKEIDISHLVKLNEGANLKFGGLRDTYDFVLEQWENEKPNYEIRKELFLAIQEEYHNSRDLEYDEGLKKLLGLVYPAGGLMELEQISDEFQELKQKYQTVQNDEADEENDPVVEIPDVHEVAEEKEDVSFDGPASEVIADIGEKKEAVTNIITADLPSDSDAESEDDDNDDDPSTENLGEDNVFKNYVPEFNTLEEDILTRFNNYHAAKELVVQLDHMHVVDFTSLVKDLDVIERIYSISIYQKAAAVFEYIIDNKETVVEKYRELSYGTLPYFKSKKKLTQKNGSYPSSSQEVYSSQFIISTIALSSKLKAGSTWSLPQADYATHLIHQLMVKPSGFGKGETGKIILEPRFIPEGIRDRTYGSIREVLL